MDEVENRTEIKNSFHGMEVLVIENFEVERKSVSERNFFDRCCLISAKKINKKVAGQNERKWKVFPLQSVS